MYRYIRTLCPWFIGAVLLLCASTSRRLRWDGGFVQAEFIVHIVDESGRPVEGASLTIRDADDRVLYSYPVTDFIPTESMVSDAKGMLSFHHVASHCFEFSGTDVSVLGFSVFRSSSAPSAFCDVVFRGKSRRVPYRSLNDQARAALLSNEAMIVERQWDWSRWDVASLPWHVRCDSEGPAQEQVVVLGFVTVEMSIVMR